MTLQQETELILEFMLDEFAKTGMTCFIVLPGVGATWDRAAGHRTQTSLEAYTYMPIPFRDNREKLIRFQRLSKGLRELQPRAVWLCMDVYYKSFAKDELSEAELKAAMHRTMEGDPTARHCLSAMCMARDGLNTFAALEYLPQDDGSRMIVGKPERGKDEGIADIWSETFPDWRKPEKAA